MPSPHSFTTTGIAELVRGRDRAPSADGTTAPPRPARRSRRAAASSRAPTGCRRWLGVPAPARVRGHDRPGHRSRASTGRPWTWDERVEVMRWCRDRGMTHYVYAPKDDPEHRGVLARPVRRRGAGRLPPPRRRGEASSVGFGISPGLRHRLQLRRRPRRPAAKVDQVRRPRRRPGVLALDDIPFRGGPATTTPTSPATCTSTSTGGPPLLLVPTEYVGMSRDAVPRRPGPASPTTSRSAGPAWRS